MATTERDQRLTALQDRWDRLGEAKEVDRQDISLNGKVNERSALLAVAFTFEELESMRTRMLASG